MRHTLYNVQYMLYLKIFTRQFLQIFWQPKYAFGRTRLVNPMTVTKSRLLLLYFAVEVCCFLKSQGKQSKYYV
jgi:hypothetical protein